MLKQALFRFAQRRSWGANQVANVAGRYLNAWHNLDYDFATNGEGELLRRCSDFRTLFDVGANRGEWTQLALQSVPLANVHCFELIPSTFRHLVQALDRSERCTLNPFGLAEVNGERQAVTYAGHDGISTLIGGSQHQFAQTPVAVDIRTGDSYCDDMGIDAIDLLKIDTEGSEHLVLEGFNRRLSDKRINVIQFEYGRTSIQTRFLLKDFYSQLNSLGYCIGKLYPNGVEFGPYIDALEDFRGPNFVAVSGERTDLIDLLAIR